MIDVAIPGYGNLAIEHHVLDYNGTLARDGELIVGVPARLDELATRLRIHVITADTFGTARTILRDTRCELTIIDPREQAQAKRAYVESLAPAQTVAVGNGRNDRLMLEAATLGIAVVGAECAAVEALVAADVAAPDILTALDLLRDPLRLVATLRS